MNTKPKYTPILRWKQGEQVALAQFDAVGRAVMPLIMLEAEQYKEKAATSKVEAKSAARAFCEKAKAASDSGLMLYAPQIPQGDDKTPEIIFIAEYMAEAGIHFVPVMGLDDPREYRDAVQKIGDEYVNGIAIRVDLQEMVSAAAWVPDLSLPPQKIDLIVDFGSNVSFAADLGDTLGVTFEKLYAGDQWRSVTVPGSSVPDNFSGFKAGLHRLPRVELALWRSLSRRGLPYQLSFGDYATISPNTKAPGVRWGYPINVKYTLPEHILVCRGIGTTGATGVDMGEQLVSHAYSIVHLPDRGRLADCWGDLQIDQIALRVISPGGLAQWVQYSVNRHLCLTTSQL